MNSKPLVLVLLVAGLAIAAWFSWSSGDDIADQPGPSVTQEGPGGVDGAAADTGKGGLAADLVAADAQGAGVVSERTEAASAASSSTDKMVSIRGRLVDSSGVAMPDVGLRRSVWFNPDSVEWGGDMGRDSPKYDFRTDSEGRFRFELARDHSAIVSLPEPELVFVNRPPMAHGHKGNQDLGDCLVQPSAIVTGIVKDERGSPVSGVSVTAGYGVTGFGVTSSGTTGEDGAFRLGKLKPGTWTLRTASAQHLPTSEELTVEAGARIEDVLLIVGAGRAIAGQVVDDLGRAVPDFKVGAKRTEARGAIEVERFANDEAATTDANGFFTLAGIDGETATVRAFGPGHSSTFAANVKVGTGNLVLQVERLAVVEGVLRGADGGPLADSRVRAVPSGNDGDLSSFGIEGILEDRAATTRTAEDGSFRIEDVSPGTVTVMADGKQHRPVRQTGIQVMPAQIIKGVQLIADRGAVVHLTVVDDDGEPVAGAKVRAEKPPEPNPSGRYRVSSRRVEDDENGVRMIGGEDSLGSAVTDAEGVAMIPGLPDGSVELHAEHTDFASAKPVTLPLLRNGSVEATLTLRTPGYAELHITGTDGAASERALYRVRGPLGASDSGSHKGKSDREGKAVVGPLAAGNYIAELTRAQSPTNIGGATMILAGDEDSAIAGAEQRFRVQAGKTTIVEVKRPLLTRVFGAVTGVDGPVAGCKIEFEKRTEGPSVPGLGGGRSVTSQADGTFEIDDVERGDYIVRYGSTEQIVKAEVELSVPAGLPELRQDLVLRTGKVRVQAWSQVDDAPIANAEVAITLAQKGSGAQPERRETRIMMVSINNTGGSNGESTMMTIGGQRKKTGADGWAEIEDVPVGDYDVKITHRAHVPGERESVAVNELQTADLGRIEMSQAGRIRGKVVDADGQQVRMALVSHRPVDGQDARPTPAMGGAFTLDALPTGRYILRAQEMSLGAGGPGAYSPEVEVEVKAGETATAELRLPKK